ncbi:c-type cytochrome [Emcibacter nanhaiensis]|uniref:Cytochrome C n=1 Tax=Emcibacter nanhaiensis TaxID=1505037 RepID=A0A501PGY5_9PROT|nr:cytochrome C [Emcibacter nanhaiensis]TPD59126.1 cytochrome C [Emcibacter nanhaiensis]
MGRPLYRIVMLLGLGCYLAGAGALSAMAGNLPPKVNWMLNCQGCHKPDASGVVGEVPSMNGYVAKFLSVEGGRDYLARVPGVAFSPLSDQQTAELLNWMLATYDPDNLPQDFKPYSGEEVHRLRQSPLMTEAAEYRAQLMEKLDLQ